MSSPVHPPDAYHDLHGRPLGPALIASTLGSRLPRVFHQHIAPRLTVYNLTIAAVVAVVTGGFATLILLMLLVGTNFNLLGAIE